MRSASILVLLTASTSCAVATDPLSTSREGLFGGPAVEHRETANWGTGFNVNLIYTSCAETLEPA